jgi:hypothetical protein
MICFNSSSSTSSNLLLLLLLLIVFFFFVSRHEMIWPPWDCQGSPLCSDFGAPLGSDGQLFEGATAT